MTARGRWGSDRDYSQRVLTGAQCQACGGKIEYLDKRSAKLAIRRMKGRNGRLNAYPCPSRPEGAGPVWHIGHPPPDLTAGEVARDELRPPNPARRQW